MSNSGVAGAEVGIVARDGERLARFYDDGLGFTVLSVVEFPQGTVCRLRRGPARCKVFQPTEGPLHRQPGSSDSAPCRSTASATACSARPCAATASTAC